MSYIQPQSFSTQNKSLQLAQYKTEVDIGNVSTLESIWSLTKLLDKLKCDLMKSSRIVEILNHYRLDLNVCTISHWMSKNFDLLVPVEEQSEDHQTGYDWSSPCPEQTSTASHTIVIVRTKVKTRWLLRDCLRKHDTKEPKHKVAACGGHERWWLFPQVCIQICTLWFRLVVKKTATI